MARWGAAAAALASSGVASPQAVVTPAPPARAAWAGAPEQPLAGPPAPPAPVLRIPLAERAAAGPFDAPAGTPAHRPALPDGTPDDQLLADPATPVTAFVPALERAYWTNPRLLAERARLRSVDFRLPQARGQYGPQLQYSASYDYQYATVEQPIGPDVTRSGWRSSASAVLSQPLFTFGRIRAGEDSARAEIAFGRSSLRAIEQQTLFNAISAYAAVIRDRSGVGIAGDNVRLLSREFDDTRARFDVRESTATDLQQVQSRLELARAQLLAAQRAAASSDAQFLRFVGAPAGELEMPNPLPIPAQTLEDAYAYADARNPVLASAYARERISRAAVTAARAERLPRIGLEGRAGYGSVMSVADDLRQTDVRGAVTITGTLDSGIRAAREGEASAANDADWRLIDESLRENRAEVADAWNEWQTQSAAIAVLRVAADAAQQALEGALLQERAGLRTTLDVLELARDVLQTRSSYNTATAAAFVARARVLAAMGALDHGSLLPEARHFDPRQHSDAVAGRADFPLVTPVVRALDSLFAPDRSDRAVRDPAAPVAIGAPVFSTDPESVPTP